MRLNREEQRVVYVCVELVHQIFDEAGPAGMENLLKKLQGCLEPEEQEVCEQIVDRLLWLEDLETTPTETENIDDPVILGELERAIDDRLILDFCYTNPITDEERRVKFRPAQFLMIRGIRYVGGYCFGSPRPEQIFRVSWITEVLNSLDLQLLPAAGSLPACRRPAQTG